jgi:ATP-dependent helicase/nuclease subunit A
MRRSRRAAGRISVQPEPTAFDESAALAEDAAARAAAVDTSRSFLLQAPAGSGKTTVLVCRLLALLASVDEPEEVLAITFTRKAAAEMRQRVLEALRRAASGAHDDRIEAPFGRAAWRHVQQRGWGLLESPARLRIMTIDAFCLSLCAQLPIASRSGLQLEVATPANMLYIAAARRALENALADPVLVDPAQRLFARLDNQWERFESLLVLMLERRAHWLPRVFAGATDAAASQLAARVSASLRTLIASRLQALLAGVPAALLQQGADLARHAAHTLSAAGADSIPDGWAASGVPRVLADDLPYWRSLCALATTAEGGWRKQWNRNQGLLPEHRAQKQQLGEWVGALAALSGARELFNDVSALPDAAMPADDVAALTALSQLLRFAAAELQLEFAAQGRVDFAAIAAAARAGLTQQGQPTDLALRFGSGIRHILIDEFQDTSLEQFELLRALTAGWETGDGRTLFAVGDPMQSIYQFREAEVGLFLRARDQGVGTVRLQLLRLRRNFRSQPGLVRWVNEHCAQMFPQQDDLRLAAIRYLPAIAAHAGPAGEVQVHPLASAAPELEAAEIVTLVRDCRARAAAATIAVLVGTRQQAAPIAAALQSAGFAIRGVRLEPLRERPVVRDLCALARALQHPGDRSAWLALLHGAQVGLTLAQLQALVEGHDQILWELVHDPAVLAQLDSDAQARLTRLRGALAPALAGAERGLPLWQRLDRAWLRLGGPAACDDECALSDAQDFIRALADEADAELLAGDAFDEFAADLYATTEPATVPGAIEILTMHGAKGLEWDVVIVPGIGRSQRGDREPLLHWLEMPGTDAAPELLLAPIGAVGARAERSLAAYIRRLRRQRGQLERARVLYVAATRARRELHWFGAAPVNGAGELAPRVDTPLQLLWPAISTAFVKSAAAMAAAAAAAAVTTVASPRWRLTAGWAVQGLPAPVTAERLGMLVRVSGTPEYQWVGLAARAVGTIVHAELQRLALLPALPVAADLAPPDYAGWLAELGVAPEERPAAGGRICAALSRTLADERGRWLLGTGHREARSEWRLTGVHEGTVVDVSIDRFLVSSQGERWLVDFKTSSHEGGDLRGFLSQEAERHRPQLLRYAALVRALRPGPLRAALYFPLLGEFREVEV